MTERICEWCGLPYYPKHGNQKYCGDDCAKYAELENGRIRKQKYRERRGGREESNGTGYIGSIPRGEFFDEWLVIQREKRRLGLV